MSNIWEQIGSQVVGYLWIEKKPLCCHKPEIALVSTRPGSEAWDARPVVLARTDEEKRASREQINQLLDEMLILRNMETAWAARGRLVAAAAYTNGIHDRRSKIMQLAGVEQ